jgi:putative SOS response-associated peptidase YedK
MPVILDPSACDRWLDADEHVSDLQSLLKPFPPAELTAYPVTTYVNTPKNQGPKCIESA